ncbi:nucleic acid/nucleotide deaminase domain-containing protein [Paenibacillus bovis]|uniref:Uncharacterized protein n=1 Tax=Paenibacillus bovis TaxID=1616788 RepID=A0A172ZJY4_9BACL|nr:nucleic acid/nucleotide deaminase domain-containing protein [Paenibacillus bovis]ANF97577.1 hypothetical protein AR543_17220 [Paenibacillus bovis]
MATGAPMAGITGAMMMISAGAPVRVSGNTNGGGGSKKGGLLGVLGKLVSTASHLYNTATENEQNARFAMFRALGKVFTQARHISKLITDPKEYIRQVHTEMDHAYRTYQQVPPEIRQYWNARYAAYQAANSKPEYDFSQYHKVFLNGQWYLSKDGKLDQDALRATKAYKEEIKKGTIQSEEAGGQQDIMLEQLNAAEAGYNLWNGQPISEAQFHLMQIDYVMSNVPGIGGFGRGIGINGPVRLPNGMKLPNIKIPKNQLPSKSASASNSSQIPRTGPEWDEYFRSRYGNENVIWQADKNKPKSKIVSTKPAIQVQYGDSDLSAMAKNYRVENKAFDLRNLVVAEVEIDGVRTLKVFESTALPTIKKDGSTELKKVHSEKVLVEEKKAAELNGKTYKVHRVYTEREPCDLGGHSCKKLLAEELPNTEVTYSFEYGTEKKSRDRGNAALAEELKKIEE